MGRVNFDMKAILDAVDEEIGDDYFVGSIVNYAAAQEFLPPPRGKAYLRPSTRDIRKVNITANSIDKAKAKIAFKIEDFAKGRVHVDTSNLKSSIAAEQGEDAVIKESKKGLRKNASQTDKDPDELTEF